MPRTSSFSLSLCEFLRGLYCRLTCTGQQHVLDLKYVIQYVVITLVSCHKLRVAMRDATNEQDFYFNSLYCFLSIDFGLQIQFYSFDRRCKNCLDT